MAKVPEIKVPVVVEVNTDQLEALQKRWDERAENQKAVINHLSGIVESAKEVLRDPKASPDQMVAALKEILL